MTISEEKLKPIMSARVRLLRIRKGLSQEALADAVGVHRATINRIERGDRIPQTPLLYSLADELGVSADDLRQVSQESSEKSLARA